MSNNDNNANDNVNSNDDAGSQQYRFAKPSHRFWQLVLASIPLLLLFCYFLYSAAIRPSKAIYNLDYANDDYTINNALKETGYLIPLFDMIRCFVIFQALWLLLLAHVWIYCPKRRALMQSFLKHGVTNLGDVIYNNHQPTLCDKLPITGRRFALVEYAYPDTNQSWWVQKQVRIYQNFSRERVSILRLPDKPFSGQPKSDIEIDLRAAQEKRSALNSVGWFALAWTIFCLVAAFFCYHQLTKIQNQDEYEDVDKARSWLIYGACIGVPILVLVWTLCRWLYYRHWIVNRGKLVRKDEDKDIADEDQKGEMERNNDSTKAFWSDLVDMVSPSYDERYGHDNEQDDGKRYTSMT